MKIPPDTLRVRVQKIVPDGEHGPYAVAYPTARSVSVRMKGSITFKLGRPVWRKEAWPEPGTEVILSDIRKKHSSDSGKGGWRAYRAEPAPA
jgi:hypothetical protein